MYHKDLPCVFVTVAGSTPQIITESLYDLIVQQKKDIREIHIITTLHGARRCKNTLTNFPDGAYYKFCETYNLQPSEIAIKYHPITDSDGNELEDIRSREENETAADFIDDIVKQLCSRDDITVLASLSGGRKSMSVYMAYAIQLHARRRDQMFHVLIHPPELESSREFFFPPAGEADVEIHTNGKKMIIPAKDIHIQNTSIPFLRVRLFLNFDAGLEINNFTDRVRLTQKKFDEAFKPELDFLDADSRYIIVKLGEKEWRVRLKPAERALYHYMYDIKRLKNTKNENPEHARALKAYYQKLRPEVNDPDYSEQGICDTRSKINKKLKETIDNKYVREFVSIRSLQSKPFPVYALNSDEE